MTFTSDWTPIGTRVTRDDAHRPVARPQSGARRWLDTIRPIAPVLLADVGAAMRDAVGIVVPVECPGCGWSGAAPCPACAVRLVELVPFVVAAHGVVGVPVTSAATYAGAVQRLIVAHKERGRMGLAAPLGAVLADAVQVALRASTPRPSTASAAPAALIVPVPSRPGSVRGRGDDTVRSLARVAARRLANGGLDARLHPALGHRRNVKDQVGLSRAERAYNVDHALVTRPCPVHLREVPVVVVDDLVTTGATLREAVRALRASGYRAVAAACIAAAQTRPA